MTAILFLFIAYYYYYYAASRTAIGLDAVNYYRRSACTWSVCAFVCLSVCWSLLARRVLPPGKLHCICECYRRRQMPTTVTSLAPYTMCRRASNKINKTTQLLQSIMYKCQSHTLNLLTYDSPIVGQSYLYTTVQNDCTQWRDGKSNVVQYPHQRQWWGTVFTRVCLSFCLFFRTIFQKPMRLGSPNVTWTCSTMSPGNSFILGSKDQRSRSRGTKDVGFGTRVSECWLF